LYIAADPLSRALLQERARDAESLEPFYKPEQRRSASYEAMVEHSLSYVRAGKRVCLAFYGHPGVFAFVGHEAISRARAEGFYARMLPAVSTEDCLIADLGIDPARNGCQTFEATDFVLRRRFVDTTCALILYQITAVGEYRLPVKIQREGLRVLVDLLCKQYPARHEVIVYLAAVYAASYPVIVRVPLADLADAEIPPMATLYVPPHGRRRIDPAMRERLRAANRELATASPSAPLEARRGSIPSTNRRTLRHR
jgi:uncharacterized protein YabN with tetrapyrrole methylase and pyrophosphatase domain